MLSLLRYHSHSVKCMDLNCIAQWDLINEYPRVRYSIFLYPRKSSCAISQLAPPHTPWTTIDLIPITMIRFVLPILELYIKSIFEGLASFTQHTISGIYLCCCTQFWLPGQLYFINAFQYSLAFKAMCMYLRITSKSYNGRGHGDECAPPCCSLSHVVSVGIGCTWPTAVSWALSSQASYTPFDSMLCRISCFLYPISSSFLVYFLIVVKVSSSSFLRNGV